MSSHMYLYMKSFSMFVTICMLICIWYHYFICIFDSRLKFERASDGYNDIVYVDYCGEREETILIDFVLEECESTNFYSLFITFVNLLSKFNTRCSIV